MYKLDISELKWKHRPGPTGDTCTISLKCSIPQIQRTEVLIVGQDILQAASIMNAAYSEKIIESTIVDDQYSLSLNGIIAEQDIQNLLDTLQLERISVQQQEIPESDADPNVFVYHAIDQQDPILNADQFANVASKYDMDTLPVGEPVVLENQPGLYEAIPFYRVDSVEMDFLNALEADRFVHVVKRDLGLLVREINSAGKYLTQTTVQI